MKYPWMAAALFMIACCAAPAAPIPITHMDGLPATPVLEENLHFDLTADTLGPLRRRRCAVVTYGNVTGAGVGQLWLVARTAADRGRSIGVKLTLLDTFEPSPQRTGAVRLCYGPIARATREAYRHGGNDVLDVALFEAPHTGLQGDVRGARRLSPWLHVPRHLLRGE